MFRLCFAYARLYGVRTMSTRSGMIQTPKLIGTIQQLESLETFALAPS